MHVVGFAGWSGSGKTTLVEQVLRHLKAAGQRVSVVKHAHHEFDVDVEGKDSWRHRQAGAFEVLVASNRRLALVREYDTVAQPDVHALIAELSDLGAPNQWVLVEGFKQAAIPKIEVWRAASGHPVQYPADPHIVAVCTDSPLQLPLPTQLPVLDLNDPGAVATFLLANPARHEYRPSEARPPATQSAAADAGRSAGTADRRDAAVPGR